MNRLATVMALVLVAGCITQPKVESTKVWEGHYFTVDEFKTSTSDVQLEKDESIWVLSNHTLSRLLKNTGKQ